MSDSATRLSHEDIVNRWARVGLVAVLVLAGLLVAFAASGGESLQQAAAPVSTTEIAGALASAPSTTTSTTTTAPPFEAITTIDLFLSGALGSTETLDPISLIRTEPLTSLTPPDPTTTTTTTVAPDPTTATTTTTPPPVTTTLPPPVTTTLPPVTTTLPPPVTTTLPPPVTTTLPPPPTTTEPPVVGFYAALSAQAACSNGNHSVRWIVANPDESWSEGWTMVIDGDSRGLFGSGTTVGQGGSTAVREGVDPGTHTLTVDVHWEQGGQPSSGFGSYSVSITVDEACG